MSNPRLHSWYLLRACSLPPCRYSCSLTGVREQHSCWVLNVLSLQQANESTGEGLVFSVNSLLVHLEQLTDPRAARGVRQPIEVIQDLS